MRIKKDNIIFFTQLPPPYAGPELMTEAFLDYIRKWDKNIIIINSKLKKNNFDKGAIDYKSIIKFFRLYIRLVFKILNPKNKKIYLTIACGKIGFLRDFIVIMTSCLFRKDIFMHLHGANFNNFYINSSVFLRFLIRLSWRRAKVAIVLSKSLSSNQLVNAAPNVPIEVVPNGVNIQIHKNNFERRYFEDNVKICFLGSLCFTKGFYDLMYVYKELKKQFRKKINFEFAGESPKVKKQLSDFLSGDIKKYYLNNYVNITNEILEFINNCFKYDAKYWGVINFEKKRKFFNSCDIFVLPSYMEGVSIAMLEAMACGLPIITSKVGGHIDIIEENINGLFVKPGDREDIYEKVERLIINPKLREKYGRNNKQKIENECNIETSAKKLYKVLMKY